MPWKICLFCSLLKIYTSVVAGITDPGPEFACCTGLNEAGYI